jgi:REP element-mobilizing transposase RayT
MARPLRYVPPDSLVEVTCRTLHGRFLLRPSRDFNEIVLGVLGRAARRYRVRICLITYLSNHCHLLLRPADARQLARFMGFVNGNLAKEAGRLHRWRERVWGRRYTAIVVSHEEAAQVARLRYLLEQGTKEGLVRSPLEWPGANSTQALIDGRPMRGIWFDRTREYEARRCGQRPGKYEFAEEEPLELSPIPAWDALAPKARREAARSLVKEIEREARQTLKASGRSPLGVRRILAQDPHDRPGHLQRSPAPRFHAQAWRVRKSLEFAYHEFRLRFRQAAEDLKRGRPGVEFPAGCFPPPMPFARGRPLVGV